MRVLFILLVIIAIDFASAADTVEADAVKPEAAEAAASCVVIHENSNVDVEKNITCFENVALERTSFESGVCQWKTDRQANEDVKTITQFVQRCPTTYRASCDRLVLGPNVTAPVKIFLYDKSDDVLARAEKQCLSGGGKWRAYDEESE